MTAKAKVVKRSDRARKISDLWSSKAIYRDGKTYRQWMSDHAKAQRARELAGQGTKDPVDGASVPTDPVSDVVGVNDEPREQEQRDDRAGKREGEEEHVADPPQQIEHVEKLAPRPKERRPLWRRRRRRG